MTRKEHGWAFRGTNNVLFLDVDAGYVGVLSLCRVVFFF